MKELLELIAHINVLSSDEHNNDYNEIIDNMNKIQSLSSEMLEKLCSNIKPEEVIETVIEDELKLHETMEPGTLVVASINGKADWCGKFRGHAIEKGKLRIYLDDWMHEYSDRAMNGGSFDKIERIATKEDIWLLRTCK